MGREPMAEPTLVEAIAAAPSAAVTPVRPAGPEADRAERFVLFSIAAAHYAVAESCVTELDRVPAITPVPRVPAWLRGVASLRGDILSVVDMRTFLGLEAASPHSARMLVVRLLDEEFVAGLLVDTVDRIVAIPPADIVPPASPLDGPLAAYLRGVCTIGERLVAVLDLDRLLRASDIRQFEDGKDRG